MPTTLLLAHPDLKTQRQLWVVVFNLPRSWAPFISESRRQTKYVGMYLNEMQCKLLNVFTCREEKVV